MHYPCSLTSCYSEYILVNYTALFIRNEFLIAAKSNLKSFKLKLKILKVYYVVDHFFVNIHNVSCKKKKI